VHSGYRGRHAAQGEDLKPACTEIASERAVANDDGPLSSLWWVRKLANEHAWFGAKVQPLLIDNLPGPISGPISGIR
jgi:hypothetical protein